MPVSLGPLSAVSGGGKKPSKPPKSSNTHTHTLQHSEPEFGKKKEKGTQGRLGMAKFKQTFAQTFVDN